MQEIKWENPAPRKRRESTEPKWAKVRSELIKNPFEWAMIKESPRPTTAPTMFAGPLWERKYRGDGKTWKVYVRYIGVSIDGATIVEPENGR